jgi:hypothetical protein
MALGSLNQMPEMVAAAAANPVETATGSILGVSAGPLLQAIGSTLEAMFAKVKGD